MGSSAAFFEFPRRNFLNGAFKVVFKDSSDGRLEGFDLVVSESALENLKPFCLAWSSSKVRIVRLVSSASDGSWFFHDVHMHQTVSIMIIPHSVAITERVATFESCKHVNPNAIKKDTTLLSRKNIHIRHDLITSHSQTKALTPTSAMRTASWTWSLKFLGQAKDEPFLLRTLAEKDFIGGSRQCKFNINTNHLPLDWLFPVLFDPCELR